MQLMRAITEVAIVDGSEMMVLGAVCLERIVRTCQDFKTLVYFETSAKPSPRFPPTEATDVPAQLSTSTSTTPILDNSTPKWVTPPV